MQSTVKLARNILELFLEFGMTRKTMGVPPCFPCWAGDVVAGYPLTSSRCVIHRVSQAYLV